VPAAELALPGALVIVRAGALLPLAAAVGSACVPPTPLLVAAGLLVPVEAGVWIAPSLASLPQPTAEAKQPLKTAHGTQARSARTLWRLRAEIVMEAIGHGVRFF
jgi:hypothetical protein